MLYARLMSLSKYLPKSSLSAEQRVELRDEGITQAEFRASLRERGTLMAELHADDYLVGASEEVDAVPEDMYLADSASVS